MENDVIPPPPIRVRPTTVADVAALRALRLEALATEPVAFSADLAETSARPDSWWLGIAAGGTAERPGVVMVAEDPDTGDGDAAGMGRLVGMAGVYVPAEPKLAHGGVVWGVFVRPAYRRRGIAATLVRACVAWASDRGFLVLRLAAVQGNGAAVRCYERCGFTAYGVEPCAVRWEGQLYGETLMALSLPASYLDFCTMPRA